MAIKMSSLESFPLKDLKDGVDFYGGVWANVYANPMFGAESALPSVVIKPMPAVKPPRPPSAYNLFLKDMVARMKEEKPDMTHKDRVKLIGQLWKQQNGTC